MSYKNRSHNEALIVNEEHARKTAVFLSWV